MTLHPPGPEGEASLRRRIAKLERMLGPFGSDPQLRLTLALALKIHEMRGI